jgi:hypothetical protein
MFIGKLLARVGPNLGADCRTNGSIRRVAAVDDEDDKEQVRIVFFPRSDGLFGSWGITLRKSG